MAGCTYVCDAQRGKVVPLGELGAELLARGAADAAQRRGHVAALLRTGARGGGAGSGEVVAHAGGDVGALLADGGHGVLVGAAGREMLAVTDTALDLLVLELVLHGLGAGVGALLLLVAAPGGRGAEDDVLADRGGVGRGAGGVARGEAELCPGLALGDARGDLFSVRGVADAAGRLDLLALLVEAVGDCRLGAVLVGDGLGGRELGRDVIDVLVVGPVGLAGGRHDCGYGPFPSSREMQPVGIRWDRFSGRSVSR